MKRSTDIAVVIVTFLTLMIACMPARLHAAGKVYVDITSPFMKRIPVAVPLPVVRGNSFEDRLAARNIARILSADLEFMGFFSVPDPSEYGGRQDINWKNFPVEYVVKSSMKHEGNSVTMEFRLMEAATGKLVTGVKYHGVISDQRIMAHRFCEKIVKAVTGENGLTLSKILFVGTKDKVREIYSADFDGYNIRRETRDRTIVLSPRYSPDGNFITYTSYRPGRPCLYIKNIRTGNISRLACYKGSNIAPAWHPDGRQLAVTLSRDGTPDIYLIDISGKIIKRLTWGSSINISPSWSPDGKKLVFVSDRGGTPQLYILNIESGAVRRLTFKGAYNTDPQWSPRGDKIAYCGRTNGKFQIFTIAPGGEDARQLTFAGSNENPSWSPDGRQIIFSTTRSGNNKVLYVMYVNGTGKRKLLNFGKSAAMPFWGPDKFMR